MLPFKMFYQTSKFYITFYIKHRLKNQDLRLINIKNFLKLIKYKKEIKTSTFIFYISKTIEIKF